MIVSYNSRDVKTYNTQVADRFEKCSILLQRNYCTYEVVNAAVVGLASGANT
jgi:hypothetical protein